MDNMLTDIEIVLGINKTISNAQSLFLDAELLYLNNRFARAYTLFQLSIEEAGKSLILYDSILRYFQGEKIDFRFLKDNGFFKHQVKTKRSIKLELFALLLFKNTNGINSKELKELMVDEESIQLSDDKKNESLYVSLKNTEFTAPTEVISKGDVNKIHDKALMRVKVAESFMNYEINDIERIRISALRIKEIVDNPELEAEYQKKFEQWINE